MTRYSDRCADCKRGKVVRREDFYDWWRERFTPDDIAEMADAIDAILGLFIPRR